MKSQAGLIRPHQSKLSWVHRMIDVLLLICMLFVSTWLYDVSWNEHYDIALASAVTLLILFSAQHDLYRSWRVYGLMQELLQLYVVWAYVIVGLLLFAFVTKTTTEYSRLAISTWLILAPAFMTFSRLVMRNILYSLRKRGWNTRSAVVVGANEQGVRFAKTLTDANWMGLMFRGFYDDRELGRISTEGVNRVEGNLDDLVEKAREGKIDSIYITMPLKAEDRTHGLINRLSDTTVSLYYAPDFNALGILNGRWLTLGETPVISIFENPCYGVDGWLKRLEDVILASGVLLVAAIPMIVISLVIKFSSPGPVIFKQCRYGINGQRIEVWKFRSMTVCENNENLQQAKQDDERFTWIGKFLRRTSLDELPQFLNVLKGDMSIVGPRPHAIVHNERYRKEINRYMMRHKVKPGITGWAQINGWRGETDTLEKMQKRVEYDLEYIRNWSLSFDLKIFFLTFVRGFVGKNAY